MDLTNKVLAPEYPFIFAFFVLILSIPSSIEIDWRINADKSTKCKRIDIKEGWTNRDIASALISGGFIGSEEQWIGLTKRAVIRRDFCSSSAEGFCYPGTYFFDSGSPLETILDQMLNNFEMQWRLVLADFKHTSPYSVQDLVILASIIQREAGNEKEMPLIASVFLNRLSRNMKLQSCATVQYILDEDWARSLRFKDLLIDSKYNTYKYYGLPPTPICNPGKAAINAALKPTSTSYLFFVADGKGNNIFGETYNEHLKNRINIKRKGA